MNRFLTLFLIVGLTVSGFSWGQKDLTVFGEEGSIDPSLNSTEATFDFKSIVLTEEIIVNEGGGDNDTRFEGDNNANLLYLDAGNDRVGIGTASPSSPLEVYNTAAAEICIATSSDAATARILLSHNGSNEGFFQQHGNNFSTPARASNIEIYNSFSTGEITFHTDSTTPDMTITADGKVGIGTASPSEVLDVIGTIECIHVTETSDERLKDNILDIEEPSTCKIKALKARSWDWKNKEFGNTIGFIAQELEQIIPEAVVTHKAIVDEKTGETIENESKAIVPTVILTHLVKTVQELTARIEELENKQGGN